MIETVVFVLGKAVRLLLKAVVVNARKNLQVNIDQNFQKECIIQVKFGLTQLVSMEPEMFLPSTIIGHVT